MRGDELVVLTRAEFEALKRQADGAAVPQDLFSGEEMQAIREQYEERIAVEAERREELEWKLRMELAKIRHAELDARRAADEMRRIEQTLLAILAESEDTQVRSTVPMPVLQPVAPKPHRAAMAPKPVPPPIPAAPAATPRNGEGKTNGSHAETFRQAMANKKRYIA